MPLTSCPACARHYRATEVSCPFCQAPAEPRARRSRLGLLLASSAFLSACMIVPQPTPVYGAPAPPFSPSPQLPSEDVTPSPNMGQ